MQPLCIVSHWITEGCSLYLKDILKNFDDNLRNLNWKARRLVKAEIQRTPHPWDVDLNQDAIVYTEQVKTTCGYTKTYEIWFSHF